MSFGPPFEGHRTSSICFAMCLCLFLLRNACLRWTPGGSKIIPRRLQKMESGSSRNVKKRPTAPQEPSKTLPKSPKSVPRAFQERLRAQAGRCQDGHEIKDELRHQRECSEQLDTRTTPQSSTNSFPSRPQNRSKLIESPSKFVRKSSPNCSRTVRATKSASSNLLVRCSGRPEPTRGHSWDGPGRPKTGPGVAREFSEDTEER